MGRDNTAVAQRQKALLVCRVVGLLVLLVRAVLTDGRFVDQVGAERVDVRRRETCRRDEVAVRELSPAIARRAQDRAEARLSLIVLQQADEHGVFARNVVIHAQDLIEARIGVATAYR